MLRFIIDISDLFMQWFFILVFVLSFSMAVVDIVLKLKKKKKKVHHG